MWQSELVHEVRTRWPPEADLQCGDIALRVAEALSQLLLMDVVTDAYAQVLVLGTVL